ncbi:MAG: TolC family protein [Oceanihabitans sp.]
MKKLVILVLIFTSIASQAQEKKWTLKECVEHAVTNNISVKQSELDLQNAEISKKDAFGNFLPTLNASASHGWAIGLSQDPITFNAVTATSQTTSGSISSGVTIFSGLQNINQMRRSNLEVLASQYQLDNMKDNISIAVSNAFLQVLFSKEQLKVLQAQQEITKENLQRTTDLVEAGSLPRGDLLEIQATIATQEQQIVNAENTILLSKISLAQLLLIEDYENFDVVDTTYQVPPTNILNESVSTIIAKAKETRYDLKIAKNNSEIAAYNLKIAKGAMLPSLRGSYSFGSNYFKSELFDPEKFSQQFSDNKRHNFGLSLSIPIFNGFSIKNNVKRSEINVERTKFQLEQASLDLETNVYQAYNDTKGALKAYEAAQKTEEARQEAFNYSQERYNVGLLNAFDFSQSKNRLEAAQSEVVRTKYDYIFKLKVLEFYFGIPITEIN